MRPQPEKAPRCDPKQRGHLHRVAKQQGSICQILRYDLGPDRWLDSTESSSTDWPHHSGCYRGLTALGWCRRWWACARFAASFTPLPAWHPFRAAPWMRAARPRPSKPQAKVAPCLGTTAGRRGGLAREAWGSVHGGRKRPCARFCLRAAAHTSGSTLPPLLTSAWSASAASKVELVAAMVAYMLCRPLHGPTAPRLKLRETCLTTTHRAHGRPRPPCTLRWR